MATAHERLAAAIDEIGDGAEEVDLFDNNINIDAEGAATLALALENNSTLVFLSLNQNNIGNEGVKALAAAIRSNTSLKTLFLFDNSIGAVGAADLATALETNATLQKLDLSWNGVGDKGTRALAAALEVNTGLQTLDLSDNSVGAAGAAALAAALKTNSSLQKLNLESNNLGDEGLVALASALESSVSLTWLRLTGNRIGDEGTTALAAALKINSSLLKLFLWDNNIGDVGANALAGALEANTSLLELSLQNNAAVSDQSALARLQAALERNQGQLAAPSNDAKWLKAAMDAIMNGDEHAWGRAKLMVVGRGAAGKTSTVRSLLGQAPVMEHLSTEVADIHRTNAAKWAPMDSDHGEFDAQQHHRRHRRAHRSSIAEAVAEVVPLLPAEDVAQKFTLRPEEQMLFRQAAPAEARGVSFTIWDYGGQKVFYALHHIFLTDKGIYLVVFDMREIIGKEAFEHTLSPSAYDDLTSQEEALEYLSFWLNSIKVHAPEAPVVLVGTYFDQVRQLDEVGRILRESVPADLFDSLVEPEDGGLFYAVDNSSTDPQRAAELRAVIAETAAEQRYVREKVPLAWLKLHEDLLLSGASHMPYEEIVQRAAVYKRSRRDADEMLSYFHGLGVVVHLRGSSVLERVVVVDPQWLLDKLARVIADGRHARVLLANRQLKASGFMPAYRRMRKEAIASRALLEWLWVGENVVDYLVEFMEANLLLCRWRFEAGVSEEEFLVSGLLSDARRREVTTAKFKRGLSCELDFSAFYLPNGVFHRLVAQCAVYATQAEVTVPGLPLRTPTFDSKTAKIYFGRMAFLLEAEKDSVRITVHQAAPQPAKIIKLLVSMFSKQREFLFRELPWVLLLHSPENGIRARYEDVKAAREQETAHIWGVDDDEDVPVAVADFAPFFDERFGPIDSDEDGVEVPAHEVPDLGPGEHTHVFLSHVQSTGGDLADSLRLKLERRGLRVWFDQAYRSKVNQQAMLDGVRHAHAYVLVMTDGIFGSAAVEAELQCALDAGKPLVIVHESDTHRKSYAPFGDYLDSAPSFCEGLFHEEESLPVRRKWYEEEAFLGELIRRCFAA